MDLLVERAKTHGDFRTNATKAQEIKAVLRLSPNIHKMSATQCESLDLICTKLGRILTGDPNEPDHWRDIAGYAQLVLDTLPEPQESPQIKPTRLPHCGGVFD